MFPQLSIYFILVFRLDLKTQCSTEFYCTTIMTYFYKPTDCEEVHLIAWVTDIIVGCHGGTMSCDVF